MMDLEQGLDPTNKIKYEAVGNVGRCTKGYRGNVGSLAEAFRGPWAPPNHVTKPSKSKEPKEQELIEDQTKENETGSSNMGRWSEGFRGPWDQVTRVDRGTAQKDSSESAIPGLWSSTLSKEFCCIYRVPNRLRRVNTDAYTPQMLLIGPLQHSKKADALELSKTELRYLDYKNREHHKKKYLTDIATIYGDQTIEEFRRIIKRDEEYIRKSYAENTEWIISREFVETILLYSIFILRFFIQTGTQIFSRKDDILFKEPCLITTILEDLVLLENQLPFVLLEELFELLQLQTEETFRDIVLQIFGFEGKIKKEVKFRHFTELFRLVRVETLGSTEELLEKSEKPRSIKSLHKHNAEKLASAGVDFVNADVENNLSLVINFEEGILKMPCFVVEDNTERVMRNIMAFEQCHYPFLAFVCNYITFLDFLIDTEQDVDLLFKKGVVKNWSRRPSSVTEMIPRYSPASLLQRPLDRYCHTVGAVIILVLTLIGTVASVLQVKQNSNNSAKSPPPPPSA
ncbi:hypothetical protein EUTSA_v10024087mg [Eutrema salsugineum]|uniref:Uncharacterized protein n=1 Tax=Eutrema salsugineum TaxID=72664 RepID=V4KER8_EUTSA|nr:hypothetical protein EUTSA_v10024087mg [Eutrema salsugineum]